MNLIYILFALVVAFLWGLQPLLHKQLMGSYHWSSLMIWGAILFFISCILLAAYHWDTFWKDTRKLGTKDITIIVFLSLITSFFASIVYYHVLKDHQSSLVSALIYSAPAFTLVLAYFLWNEKLPTYSLLGCLAILFGIVLIAM
jgi:drug/metabolite transporter (DMT)-like permease